ncbi:MAG: prepilin-type N-terminal cleavage/methylation domain-containing protein [Planctomycetia bacterium]|nr:prepilin-type N-terminal cleavage/methylation domain-containing protein [Planctomycetia bacterium]
MNRTTSRHATSRIHAPRRGFSLLEVIIAVTIVALLATLVVPRLTRFLAGANEDKAVAEVNSLANAVRLYITQNTTGNIDDDFTLEVLLDGDDPYLENSADLIDPWGTPYEIIIPGEQNIEFDVMSYGPDKKFGGEDDIIHGKR